jgi:hypothetical protein
MRGLALAAAITALLLFVPVANGANFVVTTGTDPDSTSGSCAVAGPCSLRQAVKAANENNLTTADTITFAAGVTNVTMGNLGGANNGGAVSDGPITIDGGGTVTVTVTAGDHALQLRNNSGVAAATTVKNITLTGIPAGTSNGGAALISGNSTHTVTFDHTTISNNTTTNGSGAGFQSSGALVTVNVVDSTISGNHANAGSGGGISAAGDSDVNITRSTISGNTAQSLGGGVETPGGSSSVLTVVNSTISGNSAGGGAGIYDGADAIKLSYSTIANNTTSSAMAGAGLESSIGAGSTLKGNIFSGNTAAGVNADCKTFNKPASQGFNFEGGTGCRFGTAPVNATDHSSTPINLGALANNGGPTSTHALPAGSLAIDAGGTGGSCTAIGGGALGTDQRGTTRPQVAQCDSGAFERIAPPANTALPVISGTAEVGQILTCSQGTWSGGTPQTFAFEWRRDGAAIAGATSANYTVSVDDAGHALTCRVTATNAAGSASADSAAVNVPAAGGGGGGGGGGGDGGGGGGGTTTDATPPAGTLDGKAKQDVDKLALTVGSNEAATATGQATVTVSGAKKPLTSKTATATIPADGTAKLSFKFKKKTLKKIKKQIKQGKRPKAKISVTLTDGAANSSTVTKTVKLKD